MTKVQKKEFYEVLKQALERRYPVLTKGATSDEIKKMINEKSAKLGTFVGSADGYAFLPLIDREGNPVQDGDIAYLRKDDGQYKKGYYLRDSNKYIRLDVSIEGGAELPTQNEVDQAIGVVGESKPQPPYEYVDITVRDQEGRIVPNIAIPNNNNVADDPSLLIWDSETKTFTNDNIIVKDTDDNYDGRKCYKIESMHLKVGVTYAVIVPQNYDSGFSYNGTGFQSEYKSELQNLTLAQENDTMLVFSVDGYTNPITIDFMGA